MKINQNLHALKHEFKIPLKDNSNLTRFVYSFIIFEKNSIHLIDCGVKNSKDTIYSYIKDCSRDIREIKTLILTHCHPDHIGCAKSIKTDTNCKIMAHKNAVNFIEDTNLQFKNRPVPGFNLFVEASVKIDQCLEDEATVDLDGQKLKILFTPGHSQGSICLYLKDKDILISADTVLLPKSLPVYDDVKALTQSIKKIQSIPNLKILLSSWDNPRKDKDIYRILDLSLSYLKDIDQVIRNTEKAPYLGPLVLCKRVIEKLNLAQEAFNPIVAKSFQSHIDYLNEEIF